MIDCGRSSSVLPRVCALVAVAALYSACVSQEPAAPAVATATVTLNKERAPLGSPVEITYKFIPEPGAKFDEEYRVMAHVVDIDEELMWTDDHNPPIPTTQWTPGTPVEYTRTVFIPVYPYVGEAAIHIGLYSTRTQKRLPLKGQDLGQNAYKVATIHLQPQTENVFTLFKEGWHPAEIAENDNATGWQWTKKTAVLAFKNPKKDVVFYFDVDNPGSAYKEPQQVTLSIGGQPVKQVTVRPTERVLHKIPLSAAQLGDGEMTDLRIDVDQTFVPALLPASENRDPRELGIRVFHAFIDAH